MLTAQRTFFLNSWETKQWEHSVWCCYCTCEGRSTLVSTECSGTFDRRSKGIRWTHDRLTTGGVCVRYTLSLTRWYVPLTLFSTGRVCFKCSWALAAERVSNWSKRVLRFKWLFNDHTGRNDRHPLLAYATSSKKRAPGPCYFQVVPSDLQVHSHPVALNPPQSNLASGKNRPFSKPAARVIIKNLLQTQTAHTCISLLLLSTFCFSPWSSERHVHALPLGHVLLPTVWLM